MNWMIDGAYGGLYREAMGHPALTPATDEWDVERNLHVQPRPPVLKRLAALAGKLPRVRLVWPESRTHGVIHTQTRTAV
ncbi:MAG TPA: hypothetical protein P5337_12425 [Aestuariivirga sp.]|nr:hypothetical protein [Aestuariivirga sp.]